MDNVKTFIVSGKRAVLVEELVEYLDDRARLLSISAMIGDLDDSRVHQAQGRVRELMAIRAQLDELTGADHDEVDLG